jgi:hypothetical protein
MRSRHFFASRDEGKAWQRIIEGRPFIVGVGITFVGARSIGNDSPIAASICEQRDKTNACNHLDPLPWLIAALHDSMSGYIS